jgi:hypothetical protein
MSNIDEKLASIPTSPLLAERMTKEQPSRESDTEITRCSNDTISRQAAIDLLKQMRKDGYMVPWEGKNVFARIRKLPSVQPTIMRSIGELVGYTGEPCPNCGRLRVERYKSGLEICEKCNWCEQTKSYWLDWKEG